MKKFTLLTAMAFFCLSASNAVADDEYVTYAKTIMASQIENGLPDVTVSDWLGKVLPNGSLIDWTESITGCGEQDGSGKQEDFPLCAEIKIDIPEKGEGYLYISIGTDKKGITGKPAFFWGIFRVNDRPVDIKRLSDVKSIDATL